VHLVEEEHLEDIQEHLGDILEHLVEEVHLEDILEHLLEEGHLVDILEHLLEEVHLEDILEAHLEVTQVPLVDHLEALLEVIQVPDQVHHKEVMVELRLHNSRRDLHLHHSNSSMEVLLPQARLIPKYSSGSVQLTRTGVAKSMPRSYRELWSMAIGLTSVRKLVGS